MAPADESAIYRDMMRLKPDGLTPNGWAVRAGVSRTVWADMRRHGNPSRRTLEKLLVAAGSSLAEFEALRIGAEPRRQDAASGVGEAGHRGWIPAPLPPLPLVHSQLGGEWGEAGSGIDLVFIRSDERLGSLQRPARLAGDGDAFAITIVGESMWPRFRPGRHVAVSPRSAVAIGDDVLVHLAADSAGGREGFALLAELVKRTGDHLDLRQFNPAKSFRVKTAEIHTIRKVVGELL